jgi:hypothetical protein
VDVSEWEPATGAEVAMRDALRTDDQESYFRILAGVDLLLPVSADALAGLAPLGWGTWSTGGRTHVLAFTSPAALQACLADYTGSARRVAYAELADTWPNLEWWLAVNPGLPIEGYLPAWFVAQLSRGDLRLPTRGPARESGQPSKKIADLQAAALAANAAAAGTPEAAGPPGGSIGPADHPGGPTDPSGPAPYPGTPAHPGGSVIYGQAAAAGTGPAAGPGGGYGDPRGSSSGQNAGHGSPAPGQAAAEGLPGSPARGDQGRFGPGGGSGEGDPGGFGATDAGGSGGPGPGQLGPGGLPIRTPGGVLPSGLPARVPAGSQPQSRVGAVPAMPATYGSRTVPAGPGTPETGAGSAGVADPARPGSGGPGSAAAVGSWPAGTGSQPTAPGSPVSVSASEAPGSGSRGPGSDAPGSGVPPSGFPGPSSGGPASTAPSRPEGAPDSTASADSDQASGASGPRGNTAAARAESAAGPSTTGVRRPGAAAAFGSRGGAAAPARGGPATSGSSDAGAASTAGTDLPTGTALAQTPPPRSAEEAARAGGASQAGTQQPAAERPLADQAPADTGSVLPQRQVTPPSERPPSMAAAQALGGTRPQAPEHQPTPQRPAETPAAEPARSAIAPPVIPGAGGGAQPSSTPFAPAPAVRPTIPAEQPARPHQAPPAGTSDDDGFVPANAVEQDLWEAAGGGSTDAFLSTLLLASVLVPVAHHSRPGSAPGESGFAFRTEELDGEPFLVVFTSRDRLAEHFAEPTRTVGVRFVELIRNWPDPTWSFAVNPNTPVGAKYPGSQVIALASWAAESGLGGEPAEAPAVIESTPTAVPAPQRATDSAQYATVMQKTVPAEQVDYFLNRGYDRVAGFVHRASEVQHLRTPGELFGALGLLYDGSPYQADAKEAFVLRWPAYRPSLYRIPYGGQSEQALRAMDGWVIERPPFRGNGFAPGEGRDVIAEFKVDSVRLPHGAQLWRMDGEGAEQMIAIFDCDTPIWRRVGDQ